MGAPTAVGGEQRSELPSSTVDAAQILDILDRALAAPDVTVFRKTEIDEKKKTLDNYTLLLYHLSVMKKETQKFKLDELCALVDLPRRTVRFYLQHGLVDPPEGAGRGAHYTTQHVDQLLTVKKWKQAGLSLERIRELVEGEGTPVPPAAKPGQVAVWSRVQVSDGVELHIDPRRSGLSPEKLRALVGEIMTAYERIQEEEED